MKKTFIFILALTFGLSAYAQQTASVNMSKVLQQYWKSTAEQRNLMEQGEQINTRLNELKKMQQDLVTKSQEVESQMKDSLMLSEEKRGELEAQLDEYKKQFIASRQQAEMLQQQYNQGAKQTEGVIISDIRAAVKTVADTMDVAVVYDSEMVFYTQVDLTDKVIAELNKTAPVQPSN